MKETQTLTNSLGTWELQIFPCTVIAAANDFIIIPSLNEEKKYIYSIIGSARAPLGVMNFDAVFSGRLLPGASKCVLKLPSITMERDGSSNRLTSGMQRGLL